MGNQTRSGLDARPMLDTGDGGGCMEGEVQADSCG